MAVYHVKFGLPISNGVTVHRNRQTKRGKVGVRMVQKRRNHVRMYLIRFIYLILTVDPYLLQQRIVIVIGFLCFRCLLPL